MPTPPPTPHPAQQPTPAALRFAVLLPVKPPSRGKSRLGAAGEDRRSDLAEAFALDTLLACRAAALVGAVLVATDDVAFAARVREAGGTAVPDGVAGDLNATLRQAAAEAGRRWPDLVPVALCADLPALRARDLDEALACAVLLTDRDEAAFVGDADGVGSTLYAAPHGHFAPRFGAHSFEAHHRSGAHPIEGTLPSLRRDVDDLEDLAAATDLGLGPHTTTLMNADGPPPVGGGPSGS